VTGMVNIVHRSGPPTVLTEDEEEHLAVYIADMAEVVWQKIPQTFFFYWHR